MNELKNLPEGITEAMFKNLQENSIRVDRNSPGAELLCRAQDIIIFEEDYYSKPYVSSTQNQRYLETTVPKNVKSAFVILGAGDTIFQMLSHYKSIENIVAVEKNDLQETVFKLRMAALKTLSNTEFERFLLDKDSRDFLSHKMYEQVVNKGFNENEEAEKNFWDLFLKLNPTEDISQYFIKGGMEHADVFKMRYGIPYVKRGKLFYSVREALERVTIDVIIKDALEFFDDNPDVQFDYIDITNILMFVYQMQCDDDLEMFSKYVKKLKNVYENNLNKGGTMVLDYMFGIDEKEVCKPIQEEDVLARKGKTIYQNVYKALKEEFDFESHAIESCCSPLPWQGARDMVLFIKK